MTYGVTRLTAWPKSGRQATASAAPEPPVPVPEQAVDKPASKPRKRKPKG